MINTTKRIQSQLNNKTNSGHLLKKTFQIPADYLPSAPNGSTPWQKADRKPSAMKTVSNGFVWFKG